MITASSVIRQMMEQEHMEIMSKLSTEEIIAAFLLSQEEHKIFTPEQVEEIIRKFKEQD